MWTSELLTTRALVEASGAVRFFMLSDGRDLHQMTMAIRKFGLAEAQFNDALDNPLRLGEPWDRTPLTPVD
jgi:hypothetical protein